MLEHLLSYAPRVGEIAPDVQEVIDRLRHPKKPTLAQLLKEAQRDGRMLLQPRCGVGSHEQMKSLHQQLYARAHPDVLSLTIDSHTRLLQLDKARSVAHKNASRLNGYPLIAHGWEKGRELDEAIPVPLEVRHGSPDPRLLFDYTLASGLSSFEGGPIGYNLPYCRDVSIADTWRYWEYVESTCGELAALGVTVDREIFGTLTAVLMPPMISLSMAMIEALNATQHGVNTLSIAVPQCGNPSQDVAQLKALRLLADRYLPKSVKVYTVLHQFMGVFPTERHRAESLMILGAVAARRGRANKLLTKTYEESLGIPTGKANADGVLLARAASDDILALLDSGGDFVEEEMESIVEDVANILDYVLQDTNLGSAVVKGFRDGRLDVPFSASRAARSEVIPVRDDDGNIRLHDYGRLPVAERSKRRNNRFLHSQHCAQRTTYKRVKDSVLYFQNKPTKSSP